MTNRSYSELIKLGTFEERYAYLRLPAAVGKATFGGDRWINQRFYSSPQWKALRREIILRDGGFDLGVPGRPIAEKPIIHHMNPVSLGDLKGLDIDPSTLDPENLILVSHLTHNAIHYGTLSNLVSDPIVRKPKDTRLW